MRAERGGKGHMLKDIDFSISSKYFAKVASLCGCSIDMNIIQKIWCVTSYSYNIFYNNTWFFPNFCTPLLTLKFYESSAFLKNLPPC